FIYKYKFFWALLGLVSALPVNKICSDEQCSTNQHTRNDSCHEHCPDGHTAEGSVYEKWYRRRDDAPDGAGCCRHTCRKSFMILIGNHCRNHETPDCCDCCRT